MKERNKKPAEARLHSRQRSKRGRKKKPPIIPPHIEKWKRKIKWHDIALYGDDQFRRYMHYLCMELDALRLAERSSEKYVS